MSLANASKLLMLIDEFVEMPLPIAKKTSALLLLYDDEERERFYQFISWFAKVDDAHTNY